MDWSKLAEALGLPKDAAEKDIFAAASKVVLDGKASKEQLSKLSDSLKSHGLGLEQGKVVKLATTPPPAPENETPREKELRERLERMESDKSKDRLSWAKSEAQRFIKEGKVPPTVAEKLERLFAVTQDAQSLALSTDGAGIIKANMDVAGALRDVLNALPGIGGTSLSQLSAADADTKKKESEALSAKAKSVRERLQPTKK